MEWVRMTEDEEVEVWTLCEQVKAPAIVREDVEVSHEEVRDVPLTIEVVSAADVNEVMSWVKARGYEVVSAQIGPEISVTVSK